MAIVGPTAVGKSALALRLAGILNGEIVSADSRQVYRGMDIGTDKPSQEQRSATPHHLIDIVDPNEDYSLAIFLRQAREAVDDIASRSRLPIVVGGTGQYVWGLLEGWDVPEVPPDPALRRSLEERAISDGHSALHKELEGRDPTAASRIDARNVRRVVRALEVSYAAPALTGTAPARKPLPYRVHTIGLTTDRVRLYRRIDQRIDRMIESGWVGEVQELLDRAYEPGLPSMSSVGYRELARHLEGEIPLEEAVTRVKNRTHKFARQQYAWFRLDDGRIKWYQASSEGADRAERDIRGLLG